MRENDKTSIVFHVLEIERKKQFCNSQKRCSARFDLHVWSNIGDNKTISLTKRLQEENADGKARFNVEHIIDST